MIRPLLGVSCCLRRDGREPVHGVIDRYVRAAMYSGADVVLVPALESEARSIASRLDGLLLTGTPSNVEPCRYDADAGAGPFDPQRDERVFTLVDAMLSAGRPVFGICRGFQEINVAFGGSLRAVGESHGDLAHHAPDDAGLADMFDHGHHVDIVPGGMLATGLGQSRIAVNSVHYQGVDRLGGGLHVEARSDDGLTEAVSAEVNGARVLGVQWHPEWDADGSAPSRWFFGALGQAMTGEHESIKT